MASIRREICRFISVPRHVAQGNITEQDAIIDKSEVTRVHVFTLQRNAPNVQPVPVHVSTYTQLASVLSSLMINAVVSLFKVLITIEQSRFRG